MNTDIRVKTTFPKHPKTIKLIRKLGGEGVVSLLFLWLWSSENRPSGNLQGMDADDIAIAGGWQGVPQDFISALLEVRFLEHTPNNDLAYVLHGWEEHNAWAANAEKRSEKARLAAQARWSKRNGNMLKDAKVCPEHIKCDAPSPNPFPSPSPNPSPLPSYKEKDIVHSFEIIWDKYPMKSGKKDALRHYKATVKTQADADNCGLALTKYLNHLAQPQNSYKQPMNGKTWFNNWHDWVGWSEPSTPQELADEREKKGDRVKELEKDIDLANSDLKNAEWYEDDHPKYQEHQAKIPRIQKFIKRKVKELEVLRGQV